MLLNSRVVRNLFEAAEATGLARDDIVRPLGLDASELTATGTRVDWTTFAAITAEVSRIVGDDVDRLREIGRHIVAVPSYVRARRLAHGVVSARDLYRIAERWLGPADFPHLSIFLRFVRDDRMLMHARIPDSYVASPSYLRLLEGVVIALPEVIGAGRSVIAESTVTPRTMDLVVEIPCSPSLPERVQRALRRGPAMDAILEDQTREVEANIKALQRERNELRALFDVLPDLVIVHAGEKIRWVNRSCLRVLGHERLDQVVGTPAPAALREGGLREVVLETRDGEEVIVELGPTRAVAFDGLDARLVVGRDVTERVRMQRRLLVADRLASLGLLAAGVAHEVEEPLAHVRQSLEDARSKLSPPARRADAPREMLSVALEGVERIRVIVRDLLLLSRGDEVAPHAVDVLEVVESTLALAAPELHRTVRLVRQLAPVPPVETSESRIAQVLLNLVSNALESMGAAGRDRGELIVRLASTGDDRVLLEVTDTGEGIDAAHISRVFEPFFTTKPAGQGTGLGLAIAQRLVVEIGGEINVRSTVGVGTTFRVLLPAARLKASPSGRSPPARGGATG